jgi:hypothetical protein
MSSKSYFQGMYDAVRDLPRPSIFSTSTAYFQGIYDGLDRPYTYEIALDPWIIEYDANNE